MGSDTGGVSNAGSSSGGAPSMAGGGGSAAVDPCLGMACGSECNSCPPGAACLVGPGFCQPSGSCAPVEPDCSPVSYEPCAGKAEGDACTLCAPDDADCVETAVVKECQQGQCQAAMGGVCSAQGESCAAGEACCSGLTCCSGIPVAQGSEFCGNLCPISDRNLKQDFASIDDDAILEKLRQLPLSAWSYKTEPDKRHVGPMAQDFMATFGVGSSDRTILQVDADGVALAAIQALLRRMERLEAQNQELTLEVERLKTTTDSAATSPALPY